MRLKLTFLAALVAAVAVTTSAVPASAGVQARGLTELDGTVLSKNRDNRSFRLRDFGHIDLGITVDDPKAYTKPWTVHLELTLNPDTDLIEYVCDENEKDLKHLVGK